MAIIPLLNTQQILDRPGWTLNPNNDYQNRLNQLSGCERYTITEGIITTYYYRESDVEALERSWVGTFEPK